MKRFSILIPVYQEQPHFGQTPIAYRTGVVAKFESVLAPYKPTRCRVEQLHVSKEQGITAWRIMTRYEFDTGNEDTSDILAPIVRAALAAFTLDGVTVMEDGDAYEAIWTSETLADIEAGLA